MVDGLADLILNIILFTVQGATIFYDAKQRHKTRRETTGLSRFNRSLSQSSLNSKNQRAVLIASSSINFGNDCERLVNIAFQTSQTFPSMMSTYADIIQYLRKELAKHYSDEYFHIIIGENHAFGFSVDDGQHFAEIEQEQYRILIFSIKQNPHTKMDTHDANTQMKLKWN